MKNQMLVSHERLSLLGAIALVIGTTLACRCSVDPDKASAEDVCDEVGFSIANRTLVCTGDADLGNQRFDNFKRDFVCLGSIQGLDGGVPDAGAVADAGPSVYQLQLGCATALFLVPCDQVKALGDNLDAWLALDDSCTSSVVRNDGAALLPACPQGLTRCGQSCVSLDFDKDHCGSCDNGCPTPADSLNSRSICDRKVCSSECNPRFLDCDGNPSNGCEVNGSSDSHHCNECGNDCTQGQPSSTAACVDSVCTSNCPAGFLDCDSDVLNGCETPVDARNCYTCAFDCTANGTTVGILCDAASLSCAGNSEPCPSDALNCDGDATNGCEQPTSPSQCSGCVSTPCIGAPNGSPKCAGHFCTIACDPGWVNCDGDFSNGCELQFTGNPSCDTCPGVCVAGPNQTAVCNAGACSRSCVAGYQDCNLDPDDGCEHVGLGCP